jgi:predicted ABC-type ATPase
MMLIDLKEKYKLSPTQFRQIQEQIINIYTRKATPCNPPTAIILGGQPGSGKGELITVAQKILQDNIVICNADEYRDFHPQSNEIKALHEGEYPEITVEYSQPWNNGLRAHCEQYRLNYVMETTFTSKERMNTTISDMKAKGYRVIILLLAVNERFSLLGIHLRYEEMKTASGYGRRVNKKIHDDKYHLVPETLKLVQDAKLYDQILLYRRKQVEENHMRGGIELFATDPIDPLAVYFNERDKDWSHRTKKYFTDCCKKLANIMGKNSFKTKQFLRNVGIQDKR